MRIVMPLFDFYNRDETEYVFVEGKYSLRRFDASRDLPGGLPGFSEMELVQIRLEEWALVAESAEPTSYKEEINLLLLSFKIQTLARLFIKYRLCADDPSQCAVIQERMRPILPDESLRAVTVEQLAIVKLGFSRLLEMYRTQSNRTHNAIYFTYGAYFVGNHWAYVFMMLAAALEALFSSERRGGETRSICSRVSAFLGNKPRCSYSDIERLYDIRSELVHGKRRLNLGGSSSSTNLEITHHLEHVLTECIKKVLAERLYLLYEEPEKKEKYFERLVRGS